MRCLLAIVAFTTLAWLDCLPSLRVVSGGLQEGTPNGSPVEAQAYLSRMTGISEDESSRRGTGTNARAKTKSSVYGVMRRLMRGKHIGFYQWLWAPLTAAVFIIFARAVQARCRQYFSDKHNTKSAGGDQRRLAGEDTRLADLCESGAGGGKSLIPRKNPTQLGRSRGSGTANLQYDPGFAYLGATVVLVTLTVLYILLQGLIHSRPGAATSPAATTPESQSAAFPSATAPETQSATSPDTATQEAQSGTATSPTIATTEAQSAGGVRKRRGLSDEDESPFLTQQEAETFAFEKAAEIVKQLNEKHTPKEPMRTVIKNSARAMASENETSIMNVEVIGGREKKRERSSGKFSTEAWNERSAHYATKKASGTAKEGRFSVTVNVLYVERPKLVVEPPSTASPNVDSDGKRPEQSLPETFFDDMGLSEDEAVDFSFDIATAVVNDLNEGQIPLEEIPSKLASWTNHIVSSNPNFGFALMIRAGRGPGGLKFGPSASTSIYKKHRYSAASDIYTGTAIEGPYTVQVYLTALERPAARQEIPSLQLETVLPPFLNDSAANSFALETAEAIARRLEERQAPPSFVNAALKKWTDEITSQHSESYYNLRVIGSVGTAVKVKETSSPTKEWLWNRPSNKKTANALVKAGKYAVQVIVDYAESD